MQYALKTDKQKECILIEEKTSSQSETFIGLKTTNLDEFPLRLFYAVSSPIVN